MSDAKTLLKEFLSNFGNPEKAAALFAEDGVFDALLPVAGPAHPAAKAPWASRESSPPSWTTTPTSSSSTRNITLLIDTPDQVFAEYVTHTTAAATGLRAHHLFMGRLVARNGQITLLREALNTVAAASALLPGGTHDLPEPTNEIYPF
jgi:uncharacterized protein